MHICCIYRIVVWLVLCYTLEPQTRECGSENNAGINATCVRLWILYSVNSNNLYTQVYNLIVLTRIYKMHIPLSYDISYYILVILLNYFKFTTKVTTESSDSSLMTKIIYSKCGFFSSSTLKHRGCCFILTLCMWISTSSLRSEVTCCMCCTRSAGKVLSGRNTLQTHSSPPPDVVTFPDSQSSIGCKQTRLFYNTYYTEYYLME